jgi:hypothetical protein
MTFDRLHMLDHLYVIDTELGTRTAHILKVATRLVPILHSVLVYPMTAQDQDALKINYVPALHHDPAGNMTVSFGTNPTDYESFVSGPLATRFMPHREVIRQAGQEVKAPQIIDISLAHELGHAWLLAKRQNDIGVYAAYEELIQQTETGNASLPLGLPTTDIVKQWESDTYRACWFSAGGTEADFFDQAQANLRAYEALPNERTADNFAMRIIKEVYPAVELSETR